MTRSSLKDFISIILVAPYGITRRGKVGRKFDISETKKDVSTSKQNSTDAIIDSNFSLSIIG